MNSVHVTVRWFKQIQFKQFIFNMATKIRWYNCNHENYSLDVSYFAISRVPTIVIIFLFLINHLNYPA